MSVLANSSSINQTPQVLAYDKGLLSNNGADINVTTRIDYNLRFTKQVVLVVAERSEQYSPLASQFLATLSLAVTEGQSNNINVAFISASSKLNDIQIRCRLIEQLFVNALFDPEQSIAESLLRFAKEQREDISIVIDHAHTLSLQVKYELGQLVSLAKKNKLTVNVVLFGLMKAAQQLTINKSLFKGKMTVIDAFTGQILSLDDKKILPSAKKYRFTYWHKIGLFTSLLALTGAVFWLYQLIIIDIDDNNNQTSKLFTSLSSVVIAGKVTDTLSTESTVGQMEEKKKITGVSAIVQSTVNIEATSEEINLAILDNPKQINNQLIPAKVNDVMQALSAVDLNQVIAKEILEPQVIVKTTNKVKDTRGKIPVIDNNYYENQSIVYGKGYIFQIGWFTDNKLWQHFIEKHAEENLFSYHKSLNNEKLIVVTSKVYPTKVAALAAMKILPTSLSNRKPWLKPISSVINEINTFEG
jgi:DamX protein